MQTIYFKLSIITNTKIEMDEVMSWVQVQPSFPKRKECNIISVVTINYLIFISTD